MSFDHLNDIEAALRGAQLKSRELHAIWDQRQPVPDAGTKVEQKAPRSGAKQIAWIQENAELPLLFTRHALGCEEFLLVCDAAKEAIGHWEKNGEENEKTQVVRIRQNYAAALARLGSTRDAAAQLEPCAREDFRPKLSGRFRAEILLQLGDILRQESQHTNAKAARIERAQQALNWYRQSLALDGQRPEALSRTAAASLILSEPGTELRQSAHDTAKQLLAITRELEDRDGPRKQTTKARATAHAVLGEIDTAIATWSELQKMDGVSTSELADARYYARFIAEALGQSRDLFDKAFPALQLIVFAGHLPDRPTGGGRFPLELTPRVKQAIVEEVEKRDVRVAMVSAAAGADLLFIDALLDRKATVHVVLPWLRNEFRETSVRKYEPPGKDPVWEPLFNRALDQAATVREIGQAYVPKSDVGWGYTMEVTAGLALHQARTGHLEVQPMVLWDGEVTRGNRGTGFFADYWRELLQHEPIVVPMPKSDIETIHQPPRGITYRSERSTMHQEVKSMLFADIVGYSKISELVIPEFIETFLERVSQLCSTSKHRPRSVNTWGDAVYAIFDFARDAGCFALELSQLIAEGKTDWENKGLYWEEPDPAGGAPKRHPLNVRIGLHTGPVFMHYDPVVRRLGFTGAHVNRAARIEPIAEHGQVFASEEFAAMAELGARIASKSKDGEDNAGFVCEYAGSKHLAKDYPGRFRLYRVLPKRVFAIEELAKAAHEAYCEEARARGETPGTNPALLRWEALSEDLRDANRAQIADVPNKLAVLGYELAPSHGMLPSQIKMTDEQIEQMSIAEHDRWMKNRLDHGWTYGPARDNLRKLHPLIVAWEQLSEPEREKDRDTVRNLPMLIQKAGFRVRPLPGRK